MKKKKVYLFYPYVSEKVKRNVVKTLGSKFIGQGPLVDEFEELFKKKFHVPYALAVNSCTSALELAYDVIGIKKGTIVYTPVFTCTATNIPLLRRGAVIRFMDINPKTMNPVVPDNRKEGSFVVSVDINGVKNDILSDVHDCAQGIGLVHKNGISCYSFQAIKQITTGDGGMMAFPHASKRLYEDAKLKRWFGIDRNKRRSYDWNMYKNREMTIDIDRLGYKYQMTDITATMGIGGLEEYYYIISYRKNLFKRYKQNLKGVNGISVIEGKEMAYYTFGLLVENRDDFSRKLADYGIETNLVQLRNDIYTLFGGKRHYLPVMDELENKYLYLPLNMSVSLEDVDYICNVIKKGW